MSRKLKTINRIFMKELDEKKELFYIYYSYGETLGTNCSRFIDSSYVLDSRSNTCKPKSSSNTDYTTPENPGGTNNDNSSSDSSQATEPSEETPSDPTPSQPMSNNPQTGTVGIIVVWLVGLLSIVYALWYFKKNTSNS